MHASGRTVSFRLTLVIVALVSIIALHSSTVPSSVQADNQLQSVKFRADWLISSMHSGVLFAQKQGYFEEEGLSVEIIPGSGSADSLRYLATGEVEFAFVDASVLTPGIERDVPVRSLGVLLRKNPLTLFWDADKHDIQTPQDLRGKKLGYFSGGTSHQALPAFLEHNGLKPEDVRLIGVGTSIAPLLAGQIAAHSGFTTSSPIKARLQGVRVEEFLFRDYGIEMYGLTLAVREDFYNEHPEHSHGFRRALVKGTRDALEHPDRAVQLVLEANPEADESFERRQLRVIKQQELYGSDEKEWLTQSRAGWNQSVEQLLDLGLLDQAVSSRDIMTER